MVPEQRDTAGSDPVPSVGFPALIATSAAVGGVAGCIAQLLASSGEAVSPLGASTAPWVVVGFVLALTAARRRTERDLVPRMCVVSATYLYGWLFAYHLLYWAIQGPPGMTVWAESRYWVAAVAPACVILGVLAVGSLRRDVIGDVCLGVPIALSLPEAVGAAQHGWSQVLLFALPTLLVAVTPLIVVRGRRWNPTVVFLTALLGGAALTFVMPPVTRLLNGLG